MDSGEDVVGRRRGGGGVVKGPHREGRKAAQRSLVTL